MDKDLEKAQSIVGFWREFQNIVQQVLRNNIHPLYFLGLMITETSVSRIALIVRRRLGSKMNIFHF